MGLERVSKFVFVNTNVNASKLSIVTPKT